MNAAPLALNKYSPGALEGNRRSGDFQSPGLAKMGGLETAHLWNFSPKSQTGRRGDLFVTNLTNASASRHAIYPLPLGWTHGDAARRCVACRLRVEIGVDEDELVR